MKNIRSLARDPLYMNSLYMMVSTAMVTGSGFFLWMIAARLYPASEVGLATALVSIVGFVMSLSLLGFNYSIIRFLPNSKYKDQLLSSSLLIVGLAAASCAILIMSFLQVFSPQHAFIQTNPLMMFAFVFLTVAATVDYVTEAIFLAMRQGKYIFYKNVVVVVLKLLLPVLFVSLGAFGLFMAWAIAVSSALIVSSFVLLKKFAIKFKPSFREIHIKQLMRFSGTNYVVSLTGIAPALILPMVIANTINAQSAAYFYIAFMIANLLYTIPHAVTQSLFVEGSHDEKEFLLNIKKALKLIAIILLPAMLFLLVFGNYILLIFGKSYSTEGIRFLELLAIAGIPMALNCLGLTILNIRKNLKPLLMINISGAVAVFLLSFVFHELALTGIGLAWLIGHSLKTAMYAGYILGKGFSKNLYSYM